jgi:hypothetical protein
MTLDVDARFLQSKIISEMDADELWQAVLYFIRPANLVIRYGDEGYVVYGYSDSPQPDSWLSNNKSARLSDNTGFIFKMLEQFDKSQITQINAQQWQLKVWVKEDHLTEMIEYEAQGDILPTLIMRLWLQAQFGEDVTIPVDLSDELAEEYSGWQIYPILGSSYEHYSDDDEDEFSSKEEQQWSKGAILLNHYQHYRSGYIF